MRAARGDKGGGTQSTESSKGRAASCLNKKAEKMKRIVFQKQAFVIAASNT